ncbi:MAG: late competence development ComFB family protein [Synechococcales cyanobacterium M58_A2018_015]|nr:late competence development ComFB family protein [Synechococcales cyanobacterium M58_A2018_015]
MTMGIYRNVMELLVEQEVERQFQSLPTGLASYVHPVEWAAYALNQLPPLYATSERGLNYQLQRGKAKYGSQISQAVQRALVAIRRDPLRSGKPLEASAVLPSPEVLTRLRQLLKNDKVEWHTLPIAVEHALKRASQGQLPVEVRATPRPTSIYSSIPRSSPFPEYGTASANHRTPRQQVRPSSPPSPPAVEIFGWDDPLYHSR